MLKKSRYAILLIALLILTGCGNVHNAVKPNTNVAGQYQQATIQPIIVSSTDKKAEVLALHEEWKKLAEDKLRQLLAQKKITETDNAKASIVCHIEAEYGNRALRYFVGFGAGAGHVTVTIEMKDPDGKVLYSGSSKADLAIGVFGGDMKATAKKAIEAAVTEFGAHI